MPTSLKDEEDKARVRVRERERAKVELTRLLRHEKRKRERVSE